MLSLSELLRSTVLASWETFPELEQPFLDVSLVVIFLCWSCQPKFRLRAHQLIPGPVLCSCCSFWKAGPSVKWMSCGGQMQHGEGLMWYSSCQCCLKCHSYCGVTVQLGAVHAIILEVRNCSMPNCCLPFPLPFPLAQVHVHMLSCGWKLI